MPYGSLEEGKEFTNACWYGNEGTGKTTAVATMANLGPVVLVNAEAGAKKRALAKHGVDVSNLKIWVPEDGEITYDALDALYWELKGELDDDPDAIAGVIWDSATEITQQLLDRCVEADVEKADRRGEERNPFLITQDNYGTMGKQFNKLCRKYRDLPCHWAVTALERRDQDDDGEVKYGPAVTPMVQSALLGFPDLVCHTKVISVGGVDEFIGEFRPAGKYRAKERLAGAVPRRLLDPTFERVHAYAIEEMTVEDDPIMQEAKERRSKNKQDGDDTDENED